MFPVTLDPPHLRKAIAIKAQLLTGTYLTNARLNKIKKVGQDPTCPACGIIAETVSHFVGECVKYSKERESVLSKFPAVTSAHLRELPPAQQVIATTKAILLGTTGQTTIDIPDFHNITLQYLIDIHHIRLRCT